MKHLELHIIQSVPVACLNRDDLNSPKTAIFGGVQRARVSSQSWKRAIREMAGKELDNSGHFKGKRSRLFVEKIFSSLITLGESEVTANALSLCAGHYLAKLDPKQEGKVKTLVFLSPMEYKIFADVLFSLKEEDKQKLVDAISSVDKEKLAKDEDNDEDVEGEEPEKAKKGEKKLTAKQFGKLVAKILKTPVEKAFKGEKKETKSLPKDAADIALFGRMVANDHSLTVEASSMFSHALSTHKADNEIDFFSAVDDLQPKDESGAGMTGTLEFNSANYYRFAALNLDMLADKDHLGAMTREERQSVVRTFVEATVKAIPTARKNSMNGNTLPIYMMGVIREKGHPIQLVNAFEAPVRPSISGFAVESINRMNTEFADIQNTWGVDSVFAKAVVKNSLKEQIKKDLGSIETCSFSELLDGMVDYVI
ncbi:MAG: type I-E CRISPR-associated protein Cas7/Cse4/CasC [Desulfobacteraceae bacterium]|nr:MAG: type I-E CRISPR-associated protein Cas7/Cse4/CasC [Desulfobacteraceae bacterium]